MLWLSMPLTAEVPQPLLVLSVEREVLQANGGAKTTTMADPLGTGMLLGLTIGLGPELDHMATTMLITCGGESVALLDLASLVTHNGSGLEITIIITESFAE